MTERGRGSDPCCPGQLAVCKDAGERKGLVRDGCDCGEWEEPQGGVGDWGRHICMCGSVW